MANVIKVAFKEKGKAYYFDTNNLELKENLTVIVKTERGLQFGKTVSSMEEINEIFETMMNSSITDKYNKNVKFAVCSLIL